MHDSERFSSDAGSSTGQESPLNMDKLNATFKNNTVIIKKILTSFKNSFDDFEQTFRNAELSGDSELMSRLAHSLKGSAGNIRAEVLADQAAALQHKIDDGEALNGSFDDLLNQLDDLNEQINEFM